MDYFKSLTGQAPNFEAMVRSARMIAATDVTVLITGETGTGKEVLATSIQKHSLRADQPFIKLNCAALPESLAESELFGYQKGAFTGAASNQVGKLQAADGGTLFLDEVDSMSLPLQAKLLRFLESGECQPIGSTQTQMVNVRIIAATNADLSQKVATGEFRKDFFYRLNVVPLEIPPLREREGDMQRLINSFIDTLSAEHNLPAPSFSRAAINVLKAYSWPGNVRELRNLCERLSILLSGTTIEPSNLPIEFRHQQPVDTNEPGIDFVLPEVGVNFESLEVNLIKQALSRTNGNRSKSARLLGMTRNTLLYRIHKYDIPAIH